MKIFLSFMLLLVVLLVQARLYKPTDASVVMHYWERSQAGASARQLPQPRAQAALVLMQDDVRSRDRAPEASRRRQPDSAAAAALRPETPAGQPPALTSALHH